jgi:hypothetical protein
VESSFEFGIELSGSMKCWGIYIYIYIYIYIGAAVVLLSNVNEITLSSGPINRSQYQNIS